ncbi:MAG: PIN domain-containing protein [Gammaproteobacteria bacterium]|nr:PIN domain-containing protein [Gammaproteobacteria bacterium]
MNDKRAFVDTNIWLYVFMKDDSEKDSEKKATAVEIISDPTIILSTQVVNETCVNLIRKANYSEQEIQQIIENFYAHYQVVMLEKQQPAIMVDGI